MIWRRENFKHVGPWVLATSKLWFESFAAHVRNASDLMPWKWFERNSNNINTAAFVYNLDWHLFIASSKQIATARDLSRTLQTTNNTAHSLLTRTPMRFFKTCWLKRVSSFFTYNADKNSSKIFSMNLKWCHPISYFGPNEEWACCLWYEPLTATIVL